MAARISPPLERPSLSLDAWRGRAEPRFCGRAREGVFVTSAFQQILVLTALLAGIGFLMVFMGVEKRVLDWKRRACPVCGHSTEHGCRCGVR